MARARRKQGPRAAINAAERRALGSTLALLLLSTPPWALPADEPPRRSGRPDQLASYDALIKPEDRRHWAFQPVQTPPVPSVKDLRCVRNPIDWFVLGKLEEKGWSQVAPAEPQALLRRLFLDVTGLPPAPEERAAFLEENARSPGAVEKLVDDLLARPEYGERWARHWLDLVRYAESNGFERDADKPFAWRYRDYVIRAFNSDKPFDRFVVEQLAGDELPDAEISADTLVATGMLRLGPWDDEPADPKQDRYDQLDDLVNTTSQVFLGLTLGCARCHNHKFEPLSMHDYYRMVAIFEPLERPTEGRTELTLPIGSPSEIASHPRGPSQGYFLREQPGKTPVSHILLRGQAATPGQEVGPGVPAVLVAFQPPLAAPAAGARTSQRRLRLARWLTSRSNPLLARVMVNRIWQHHFGAGLVRTPSDFGTAGDPPTHPELLDWLAAYFVEHGFSVKAMHRLILTSNTYRMGTRCDPHYAALDPENLLLWRMPLRRVEIEVIRDAMLAASGRLNRRMYGPSMYPFVPREALEAHSDPGTIWKPFDEASASRRTIYAFARRSLIVPMLEVLDFCDTTRSAAKRNVTNVPTQALTLLNGDFVNGQARHLAARLAREAGPDLGAQIERAYSLTLSRPPSAAERSALRVFVERDSRERRDEAARAGMPLSAADARHETMVQVCRALFNTNEFVFPD
jgi:hypothetical protein